MSKHERWRWCNVCDKLTWQLVSDSGKHGQCYDCEDNEIKIRKQNEQIQSKNHRERSYRSN